jgi:SAM-dependent methyltransferase
MRLDAVFDDAPLEVIRQISPNDTMFQGDEEQYFRAGLSALRCVRLAVALSGGTRVRRILDLPCGYGRVLRSLRAAFPEAEITACDLDRAAVDFCVRVFNARPSYSDPEPERIALQGPFDVIWVGSLFTHLAPASWNGFLRVLHSLLGANGLLLLTTEGRFTVGQLRSGRGRLGLSPEGIGRIVAAYERDGHAFESYPSKHNYGCCLSSPSWVCGKLERLAYTRLLYFMERGWMGRQDVFACLRDVEYAGFVDRAGPSGISGWAWDVTRPEHAVRVDILVDGTLCATVVADQFRGDLLRAKIGNGEHGFSWAPPPAPQDEADHLIEVRIAGAEVHLHNSPKVVRW